MLYGPSLLDTPDWDTPRKKRRERLQRNTALQDARRFCSMSQCYNGHENVAGTTLTAHHPIWQGEWAAHEFHYATTVKADGQALFHAWNAEGEKLPPMGLINGSVSGSFAHLIDKVN